MPPSPLPFNVRDIRESFYITESELDELNSIAQQLGLSRSSFVRMVWLDWVRLYRLNKNSADVNNLLNSVRG